jgi:hypothetical protein
MNNVGMLLVAGVIAVMVIWFIGSVIRLFQ